MSFLPVRTVELSRWAWSQGWSQLRRMGGGRAAIAGVAGCCLILQLLLLFFVSGEGSLRMLRDRTALQLEVLPGATDQQISSLYAALRQHPSVEDVRYNTRQQIYEAQRESDPSFIAFLEKYQLENPFPDTLGVIVRSVDDYRVLGEFLQEDAWREIVDPAFLTHSAATESEARAMMDLLRWARWMLALFLVAGVAALGVMVGRTVSVERRGDIEALLGGNTGTMLSPSFVAAAMLLLLGVSISALVGGTVTWIATMLLSPDGPAGAFLRGNILPLFFESAPLLLLIELLLIVPVALLAAAVAVRTTVPAPSLLHWGSLPLPR